VSAAIRLRDENDSAQLVDLYFVPVLQGLCGWSSFTGSPYQGILIANECATNLSSTAHEIGHYFDLYHTHETGNGVECPSGSNCSSAGDLVCDTAADPDLSDHVTAAPACTWDEQTCESGDYQGTTCFSDVDCNPSGEDSCTADATGPPGCGSTSYAPDPKNLMSYSRKDCRDTVAAGQSERFRSVWLSDRPDLFERTEYVAVLPGGPGDGSPTDPWRSVMSAVDNASAGDHVFIRAGDWHGRTIIDKRLVLHVWNEADGSAVIGAPF